MKISLSFPPLESAKGTPLLTQNRQFQWFNSPTYIYPMVPAYAGTLLSVNGYEVMWDDGIAEEMSYKDWIMRLIAEKPDVIAIETKTPVVERHWDIIKEIKQSLPESKIVLMGDHVMAFPKESFVKCPVDFVICAGDFDFVLLNIANYLSGKEELKPGVYYRSNEQVLNTGKYEPHVNKLSDLPMIDRELTKWKLYAEKNGNFKHTPGAYMMSGRDCWWGKCTFCSWTTLFPGNSFRTRTAEQALDEVEHLVSLGVKEIMEDSGSLPIGDWLKTFCHGMIERRLNEKVTMSCNMRINGIKDPETWKLMKKAGFRFILFGLESANQVTLDKIEKSLLIEDIEPGLKMCKDAGLEPHITAMIGYPWESRMEAQQTINLAKKLFQRGYVDTLQATVVIPYPGTPLYNYCRDNELLNFTDYDRFDQREQVMKSELSTDDVKKLTQELYKAWMNPQFIWRKLTSIRSKDDVRYIVKSAGKVFGHLSDFSKENK